MIRPEILCPSWPQKPLGEAVKFLDHLRRPITARDRVSGPYPYYGANGQQDSVADYIFNESLILMAEDGGYFGDPDRTIAYRVDGKCWVNNHAHVLRPKDGVDIDFLCRQLENYDVTRFINGATRQKLNKSSASEIPITLPSLAEQKRIAAILDKAHAIRRKRRQAIQQADEFLRSVFLDMFGDSITNYKGWPQKRLAELAQIIVPTRDKPKSFTGNIPWVTLPDIDGLFVGSAKNNLKHDEARFVKNRLMPKNTVLISCAGSLGVSAITTRDLYANQQFYGLYSKQSKIEPLYLLFNLYNRPEKFYKKLAGTVTISFYSKQKAADILIGLPPIKMQNKFSQIVLKHKEFLSASHKSYGICNVFLKSLTQRAFRGEL